MDADAVEIRVLGCLLEKQRTTPDAYPLSLNALRLACNQTTNRDPVVDHDEQTIRGALDRLSRKGWVRLASGPGSRAAKYRHLLDQALGASDAELPVLAVLMLRGAQTPGELKARTDRLHVFGSLGEVETVLEGLIARDLVARLARRPGRKEVRYRQLLGGDGEAAPAPALELDAGDVDRLDELERRVHAIEEKLSELLDSLPARRESHERDANTAPPTS
ncbi:MAG TPA: YceH family protein [Gaiellaceae bacterium]|nr:YceH family protein [Gaiellaceae bacterium]